jgi:hypothetical protein
MWATPAIAWAPLVDGKPQQTDQEGAEVVYVPDWSGHSRNRDDYGCSQSTNRCAK